MALQHLRSNTASKRPTPGSMSDGQLAINTNATTPGLFFKDAGGALVKVGPVFVGTSAPNSTPAGSAGNALGEQWLDTSGGGYVLKIWDGSAWRSEAGEFVDAAGDTMTGALILPSGTAAAPALGVGSTDNGIYSPGADQVAISTNGTGQLFVNSAGAVTIPTRFIVGSANNVGGISEFTRTTAGVFNTSRLLDGGTNPYLQTGAEAGIVYLNADGSSAPAYSFRTQGSERLRITSDGKVGVGTSSPSSKLSVQAGNSNTTPFITALGTINGTENSIFLRGGSTAGYYYDFKRDNTTGYLEIQGNQTGYNNICLAPTSGNVGVGISTPQATFHTNGAILSSSSLAALSASNIFIDQPTSALSRIGAVGADDSTAGTLRISQYSSAGAIGRDVLSIDSTGNVGVGTTSPGHSLDVVSTSTAVAEFNGPANAAVEFKGSGFVEGKIQCGGEFIIGSTNNYPVAFVANNTERARIDSSGRLGVGTSSPQAITQIRHASTAPSLSTNTGAGLAVDGTSSVQLNLGTYPTSPYAAWIQARDTGVDTAYPVVINPLGGNVGVGTTSPVFKFDVSGGAGNGIRYTNATNSVAGIIGADSSTAQYGSTTSHPVAFLVGSVERARIDTSGRLGIGTTSPTSPLQVIGGSTVTDPVIRATNSGATQSMALTSAGLRMDGAAPIQIALGGSEVARFDTSGRLLVGTSTSRNVGTFVGARLQVEHQGSLGHTGLSVVDTADTATVSFGANNSGTVCANNKHLAEISFAGNDGTDLQSKAASINVYADGTWGNDDTPGRLVFSTTADGASSPTERMRIKSNGTINFSSVATYADNTAAKAGGLVDGDVYRTATGQLMIVFT